VNLDIDLFSGKIGLDGAEMASPNLDILQIRNAILKRTTIVCSILEKRNHKTYFCFEENLSLLGCPVDAFVVEYTRNNCNACFIHFAPMNKEERAVFESALTISSRNQDHAIVFKALKNINSPGGKSAFIRTFIIMRFP
jgi:hypothetical protein